TPPVRSWPFVTLAERDDARYGVQLQIPQWWLRVPATLGGPGGEQFDLTATVALPPLAPADECAPIGSCRVDNVWHLRGIPSVHVPPISVRTVALTGPGQTI